MLNLPKTDFAWHCTVLLQRFPNLTVSSLFYVNSLTRPLRPFRIKTWIRAD